jgi:outer membrane protein assembly factor BamD (BamD/ComL family)
VASNLALGSNFNLKVRNPDLEFPLIIKFKSYTSEGLSVQDLLPPVARTNILTRTNTVTNRISPVAAATAGGTNDLAAKKNNSKKRKKKGEDEKLHSAAVALFNHGEYPAAAKTFGAQLALAPDGDFADPARIYLGRMEFASNRLEKALSTLDSVRIRKSEAAYWKTVFLVQKTNDTAAIEVYEARKQEEEYDRPFFDMVRVVSKSFLRKKLAAALIADIEGFLRNPAVTAKPDAAVFALAELYEKDKQNRNMKKAWQNYDLVASKYPSSPLAAEARKRAAFIRNNFLEIR